MFEDWHSQSQILFFIWKYLILSKQFVFVCSFLSFQQNLSITLSPKPGQMFGAYIVILKIKIYFNNFPKC